MSLAEKMRGLGYFTPTYGVCGGSRKVCGIKREELDPIDRLFYDHDNIRFASSEAERRAYDEALVNGLKNLSEADFEKVPFFQLKWPFFKRWYAKSYVEACKKIFV